MTVEIANQQRHMRVPRKKIAEVVGSVLAGRGMDAALVSLAVVDNRTIRAMNRRFLGHDRVTDVISFPAEEDETDDNLLGDVVVSAQRAAQEAKRRSGSPRAEMAP